MNAGQALWTRLGVCLALVVALALVYGPVVRHEFLIFDDNIVITDVAPLERGLSVETISWALTTSVAANWFPLTLLSYLVEFELHGLSAAGVHRTNLLLHMASSVLLFLALLRMTGALWRSAFVAAVFALHPLNVETVAWAAERKGVLAGSFWMLALFVYAGAGRREPTPGRLAGVALALALGLMAKGVLMTLPFALLLLDFWPLGRQPRLRLVLEKLPLLGVVLLALTVTLWAQRSGGAAVPLETLPLALRVGNAALAYTSYLGSYLVPRDLAVFYPHPGSDLPWQRVAAAALLLLGLTGVALWQRRARPYLTVGWLWYLGTLVPMIGLVQLGSAARADRYSYIPMLGISLAVTWLLASALEGRRRAPGVLAATAAALLAVLAVTTSLQLRHWRSSVTLLERAIAVTEGNHVAHHHLAAALALEGRPRPAIEHYREALRSRPGYLPAANDLAWLLATHADPSLGDPEEAVRLARQAAQRTAGRDPRVLDTLAAAHAAAGRYQRAVWYAGRALELTPRDEAGLRRAIRARLELYLDRQPYREAADEGAAPDEAPASE